MTEPSDSTAAPAPVLGIGLAALWLLLPAIQYLSALERTAATVQRRAAADVLASLDLTPWYMVLLAASAVYACFRLLRPESPGGSIMR